jgi:hypothetical protein
MAQLDSRDHALVRPTSAPTNNGSSLVQGRFANHLCPTHLARLTGRCPYLLSSLRPPVQAQAPRAKLSCFGPVSPGAAKLDGADMVLGASASVASSTRPRWGRHGIHIRLFSRPCRLTPEVSTRDCLVQPPETRAAVPDWPPRSRKPRTTVTEHCGPLPTAATPTGPSPRRGRRTLRTTARARKRLYYLYRPTAYFLPSRLTVYSTAVSPSWCMTAVAEQTSCELPLARRFRERWRNRLPEQLSVSHRIFGALPKDRVYFRRAT